MASSAGIQNRYNHQAAEDYKGITGQRNEIKKYLPSQPRGKNMSPNATSMSSLPKIVQNTNATQNISKNGTIMTVHND